MCPGRKLLDDCRKERDKYKKMLNDLLPHIIHVPKHLNLLIELGEDRDGWLTHELNAFERDIKLTEEVLKKYE